MRAIQARKTNHIIKRIVALFFLEGVSCERLYGRGSILVGFDRWRICKHDRVWAFSHRLKG